MATQSKAHLTEAEYLALDREATVKSEYFDGEMFAIVGGRLQTGTACIMNSGRPTGLKLSGPGVVAPHTSP